MKTDPIVWAIDPYQKNERVWQRSKELAYFASRALKRSLQPVYIAESGFLPAMAAFKSGSVEAFVEKSKSRIKKLLTPLKSDSIAEAQVIFAYEFDMESEVRTLNSYAMARSTPLILVSTSARSGFKRLLEGSFAETLATRSQTPILIVNPKCKALRAFKRIVFATDFSAGSKRAFAKLCETASAARASIEIVSVMPDPMYWIEGGMALTAGADHYLSVDVLERQTREAKRDGLKLVAKAAKLGVKASFKLEERPVTSVSAALLKNAKEGRADMIALAARGDTSKVHLFGSTAQEVIRESDLPVWIFHGKSSTPVKGRA